MSFTIKDILRLEVRPALGCTEPVAVALASAAAASLLKDRDITGIQVWVDPNVFKNGLAVIIPGTRGLRGLDLAAALGALGGDPEHRMQVLDTVTESTVDRALRLIKDGSVRVFLDENRSGLFVKAGITASSQQAEAVVQGAHDTITELSLDGTACLDNPLLSTAQSAGGDVVALESWLRTRSLAELHALMQDLDGEDLKFLKQGVDMNLRLADCGLNDISGLGVGRTLSTLADQGRLQPDMVLKAKILTAAAADARMAGAPLPAMSSAGSGNNGLTTILPVWAVAQALSIQERKALEAIALSHIVTAAIKTHTGKLSAVCSCSLAAGAGAAAGIVHMQDGTLEAMAGAIGNLVEDLGGVICDGAKGGCALKLATAAGSAVQAALLALHGVSAPALEGILGPTPDQTLVNLGRLCREGMTTTGRTILDILLEKNRAVE
jgi:L-cysteine desulfidase